MTETTDEESSRIYLQELQPVIELLGEGKRIAAESICEIISKRYPEEGGNLHGGCRDLFESINAHLSHEGNYSELEDIRTRYQELKEKIL